MLTSAQQASQALADAGFVFKNTGFSNEYQFHEYVREKRSFLQRIVLYVSRDLEVAYSVLRTKCATAVSLSTVYDVEHLLCRGVQSTEVLIRAADSHWQQFELTGGNSFFRDASQAIPHYDLLRPQELLAA
jgi:hypothetical protein